MDFVCFLDEKEIIVVSERYIRNPFIPSTYSSMLIHIAPTYEDGFCEAYVVVPVLCIIPNLAHENKCTHNNNRNSNFQFNGFVNLDLLL